MELPGGRPICCHPRWCLCSRQRLAGPLSMCWRAGETAICAQDRDRCRQKSGPSVMKMIGAPEPLRSIKSCNFSPDMPGIWLSGKMQDVSDRYVGWAIEVVNPERSPVPPTYSRWRASGDRGLSVVGYHGDNATAERTATAPMPTKAAAPNRPRTNS